MESARGLQSIIQNPDVRPSERRPAEALPSGRTQGGTTVQLSPQAKLAALATKADTIPFGSSRNVVATKLTPELRTSVNTVKAPKVGGGAHALARLLDQSTKGKVYHMPVSGIRYKEGFSGAGQIGAQVGPYIIRSDKQKGVEPGFIGTKAWMPKDQDNMLNKPDHKFYKMTNALLSKQLDVDLPKDGPLAAKAAKFVQDNHADEFANFATAGQHDDPLRQHDLGAFLNKPENAQIKKDFLHALKQEPTIQKELSTELMRSEPKFAKNHYVKLDYVESDIRWRDGKVRIPEDKQKFTAHREFTAQTRTDANRSAVRECLANDLMKTLGVYSQNLKITPAAYSDGAPKLLLDSTHVTGPNGESFDDFDGSLRDGFVVQIDKVATKNQKDAAKAQMAQLEPGSRAYKAAEKLSKETIPVRDADGRCVLDTSIEKLGRNKVIMLLLADRDALGSTGGNKGRAGNTFVGIDPGHALEEDLLGKRGDVRTDLSFTQPSMIDKKGYKNLTIFDQQPFSEKMEGVRKLHELAVSKEDEAVFDEYAGKFDGSISDRLNFKTEIDTMKTLYIGRRNDLLNTFAERLAVDNFSFFGAARTPGATEQRELSNKTLDLLDNLEKLTSATQSTSKKGQVTLERPQIINNEDRREWHVAQAGNGSINMSFNGSRTQANEVMTRLNSFVGKDRGFFAEKNNMFTITHDSNRVTLSIKAGDPHGRAALDFLASHLNNDAIMAHKAA